MHFKRAKLQNNSDIGATNPDFSVIYFVHFTFFIFFTLTLTANSTKNRNFSYTEVTLAWKNSKEFGFSLTYP